MVADCGLKIEKGAALQIYADPSHSIVLVKSLLKEELVKAASGVKVLSEVSLGSFNPLLAAIEAKLTAAINKFLRIRNRRGMDGVNLHLQDFDFVEDGSIIYPSNFEEIIRADFTIYAATEIQEEIYEEAVKLREAIQAFSDRVWALGCTNPNMKVRGLGELAGWRNTNLISYSDDLENHRQFIVHPEMIQYIV